MASDPREPLEVTVVDEIDIHEPNSEWPDLFQSEADLLRRLIGEDRLLALDLGISKNTVGEIVKRNRKLEGAQ